MKGKLYLRSFYEGIMENVININIARGNMNGIGNKLISLAPSPYLFKWYMDNKNSDNWFETYRKVYMNQLKGNTSSLNSLSNIRNLLDEGNDVCIYCFCRNVSKCHRGIVGDLFVAKGYEVIYK